MNSYTSWGKRSFMRELGFMRQVESPRQVLLWQVLPFPFLALFPFPFLTAILLPHPLTSSISFPPAALLSLLTLPFGLLTFFSTAILNLIYK
jgi:hypothetical protein